VGSFRFPAGDAGAVRVRGMGKALREAGLEVLFAGVEKRGRPEDLQPDGRFCYDGFSYVPEQDLGNTRLSRLKRAWLTHLSGATTMRRLRSLDLSRTRAVIAYEPFLLFLWQLRRFCRRRGIGLIVDCTEWYDPWHRLGGLLGWESELRNRWLQPKVGRLIAISSYLERYYRQRGCSVLRVPPLIDMDERSRYPATPPVREDGTLRLIYAGMPAKKDLLANAILGLRELRASRLPVVLELVGPSRESLVSCVGGDSRLLDELGSALVCRGPVPHQAALDAVSAADFTILLRPNKRYAQAGFPSKLVESLSLGVPIITNPTSDIAEYVRDGQEGILLADSSPGAFAAAVKRVLEMPRARWLDMRAGARQRAWDCFDYRQYVQRLREFTYLDRDSS
jgi:glycosyltransferase involved in cell wall biosynthesis